MSPVRPVPVTYAISGWGIGGTPRHLLEVLGHVDREAFTPALYCLKAPPEAVLRPVREVGIPIGDGRLKESRIRLSLATTTLRMAADLRRRRVRIVHSYLFDANLIGTLAARLARVPVAIVSKRSLDRYERRRERLACRIANRLATCITVPAEAVRRHVHAAEGCPLEKMIVIPNGIDLTRVAVAGRGGPPVIGTVGRLEPRKGHADLVDAARVVLDHVPGARFVMIGDGPARAELEQRTVRHRIAHRVDMRGMVPDGARLLTEMSLFVLPSHVEGMSNALLEAMAAGLPVVATDVGGNAEVVVEGETGLLVPPRDPAALGQAILVMLKDPERARAMGAAGRARALEHFSVQRMVARHQALYISLLDGEKRVTTI